MTGKELLEAMSYVDEEYVARADRPIRSRRVRWQPLAAMAACFCLILFAASRVLPVQKGADSSQITMAAGTIEAAIEEALDEGANRISGACVTESGLEQTSDQIVLMSPSSQDAQSMDAALWITVRVEARTEQGLLCTVIDPGTGAYPADAQVTVALPEEDTRSTLSQKAEPVLQITYRQSDGDVIYAEALDPVEDPPSD